jgi:signal transduction histidine kinase
VSLVDNAIKFSPQGGEITVRVWPRAGEGLVSVKDYGMGIAKERQPHVFEPFYEYVPYGTPGYRGTVTLSLYLAKLTVERHKGRIWFESESGKGSTFTFALPLA